MLGNWNVNVSEAMPQKVATAMGKLGETLLGAEYEPIAYLGSQVVNGTNHAVLAKQIVVTGRDTKNIVVIIFNEKPNDMNLSLVSIDRVLESGAPMGGIVISDDCAITEEAGMAWDTAFEGFVGSKVEPFAYLGSQVVKGVNHIFAATVTPVVPNAKAKVAIVTVNGMTKEVTFSDILENRYDSSLGYSFTWLKFGAPLGEWP